MNAEKNPTSMLSPFLVEEGTLLRYTPAGEPAEEIAIPEGITAIGQEAFFGCKALSPPAIPESVVFMGTYVFS